MRIINTTKNAILADEAGCAATVFSRMKGLLGKDELPKGKALFIRDCNCVHTFFMRFAIDLVFLDKDNRAVKIIPGLKPWRITGIYFNSRAVIEFPAGTLSSTPTQEGDIISIQ